MEKIVPNGQSLSDKLNRILPRFTKSTRALSNLRSVSHIPIFFFFENEILEIKTGAELSLLSESEQPLVCDPSIAQSLSAKSNNYPDIHEETYHIYYCTQMIAENITCILGPLSYNYLSESELVSYMKEHHMHDFKNFQINPASPNEAYALMSLVYFVLTGNYSSYQKNGTLDVPADSAENHIEKKTDKNYYVLQNHRMNLKQHMPYVYEQRMYDYVKNGDLAALNELISGQMTTSGFSHGQFTNNKLKQQEYLIVSQIKMYTRAAIDGGVNPYDAYDISDILLKKLSSKASAQNYIEVMHECNKAYTSAVKKARSIASYSVYIEKCKYYISMHLQEPFSISDIAEYTGLSPAYLGTLFRQHTNCTLKHYIILMRLDAAKNMLKYSDYNVSTIAQYLCFQSQSHFGSIFKKETGMTPAQFRKTYKPQNF